MKLAAALAVVAACSSSGSSEPPAGPKAATAAQRTLLGVVVGETPIAAAKFRIEGQGLRCDDASLMAMMRAAHAQHGVAEGPDGGPPPPAPEMPAGHGKYLDDPALQQARITCANVPLALLGDDRPAGLTARVLLVADTATGPVRLIAVQRTHTDGDRAADDARATFGALTTRYGAAAEPRGDIPAPGARLVRMSPVRRTWRFTDLVVEASATDLGGTGISVSEELRVP